MHALQKTHTVYDVWLYWSWIYIKNPTLLHLLSKKDWLLYSWQFNGTAINSDNDSIIIILGTVWWHLGWNSCAHFPSWQDNRELLLLGLQVFANSPQVRGNKTSPCRESRKCKWPIPPMLSLLLVLKMELCVSAQGPEGARAEKLVPAGRLKTKVQNLLCLFSGLQSAAQVPGLGNCCHSLSPARLPKRGQLPRNPPESRCLQMGRWRRGKVGKACTPIPVKTDLKHFS